MNGLLHQGSFNPAYYQGSFSLAMRESSFELFAPVLQHLSQQLSNHAHLNVHAKEEMSFDALARGQVDFFCCFLTISANHPHKIKTWSGKPF